MKTLHKRMPSAMHVLTVAGYAAVLAVAGAGTISPAHAQEVLAQQSAPAAGMDDDTLRAFAQATIDVEQVIDKWSPKISEADDEDESAAMRKKANAEIIAAVRSNDMSMDTYNRVYQFAQSDPEVATTVQAYREDLK